jgi:ERF superfamily
VVTSQEIGKLATALAHAQAEMSGATKDARNPHFGSTYADLASVVEACKPLAAHGIAILQPTKADGARVTVTTMLTHESGEWIAEDLVMTAKDPSPQAVGSAITYGRRYGLMAMVGLAPEDDDGNAAQPAPGKAAAPKPATKPEAPPEKKPGAPPMPIGFATWWADLEAVADNGTAALEAMWTASPAQMKKYLKQHHGARLETLKARAATREPTS